MVLKRIQVKIIRMFLLSAGIIGGVQDAAGQDECNTNRKEIRMIQSFLTENLRVRMWMPFREERFLRLPLLRGTSEATA